ncbi:MAG: hybrid sensor histidine kinase/response regulator [Myxococcales bacterium]|nr:MAG: hybrid sensor histidine kinase/response regulator [Myxococcales bacterium]
MTAASKQLLPRLEQGDLERVLALELRYSRSLEELLSATAASGDCAQLLPRVVVAFQDLIGAPAAVLWMRDGALFCATTASGVAADWRSGARAAAPSTLDSGPMELPRSHELCAGLRGDGICVLIPGPELPLGVICLQVPVPGPSAVERSRLPQLARHAASAIAERTSHDELMRSLRARDEVLGIVAHDLRNPLNVIAAASSSLHQRLPDLLSRRPVERIMRATQRAEHLIRDLLDISAIESGQFSIDKRQLDTANTILAATESQQGLAATSSVILASDLSPELPGIDADEERILEVLENLVGNAIKFTLPGGTVTVGASEQDGSILLWVRDTGPGIPEEQLPHLFDRFWQGSKGDRRGAGLGLTICRAIVEAHGGRIWAESVVGQGTTIKFTLPKRERVPQSGGTQVANILMVDDRPENLLALRAILEQPDYRLVTASSGEEALSLALRETFAVALIDVAMPGMDGLEVAIHMKELERSRDIPIIFITAFGDDPQEIHRAYSAGGADYLVKPLDAEIVRKKVAVFVDLSRRRSQSLRRPPTLGEE